MISFVTRLGVVALAIGLSAVTGCQSDNTTTASATSGTTYSRDYGHDQAQPAPTRVEPSNTAPPRTAEPELVSAKVAPSRAVKPPAMTATAGEWVRGKLAFPTGDQQTSALLLEKSIPAEIMVGRPFDHEIKVTNISSGRLDDVEVEEAIPAGYKLAADVPEATVKDGVIRYQIGDLPAGGSKTVLVKGAMTGAGSYNTCTSATYKAALCMSTAVVAPGAETAKTAPAEVLICDTIPMKLTVTNAGTGSARNIQISDPLPAGMTTEDGKNSFTFNVGTLAAGQSKDITFNAKVNKIGKFETKANAKGDNGLIADANLTSTLVREPVLAITKSGPEKQYAGRPVTYEITVTNKGDAVAVNTVLVDPVPSAAKFDSATEGGRVQAGNVQWSLGDIQPGASKKVSLTLSGINAGVLKSQATAQAKCAQPVTAVAQTEFAGISAILLECVDASDPIEVGQQETYIITVTNQGSANDNNIKITCGLEEPMQFVSCTGGTPGTTDGKVITFAPLATLAPKAKAEWRVVVKAISPGDVRFKVEMISDQLKRAVTETESSTFYK